MTSAPVRDPLPDHLFTPQNAAFLLIDYQLSQLAGSAPGRGRDRRNLAEAHRAGLDRVMQAGAQPVSWVSLAVELQRDWNRQGTAQAVIEIVLTGRLGPYRSPAASYLFSAAYEPAEALPVASPEPSPT